jgi:hypothetical protein
VAIKGLTWHDPLGLMGQGKAAAMRKFVAKHAATTTGRLSCFDRLLFKGHLAPGYEKAMEDFL